MIMPNDSLISALQVLREEYSQRQKSTHNLISALKGKSSAFGRIQQALGDYANNNATGDTALAQVQQSFGMAQESINPLVATLGREAKSLAAFTGAIKGAIAALSADPIDVARLSHPVEVLTANDIEDQRLAELLPELTLELKEAQEALGAVFGSALREAMAAQSIEVTGTSPKFEVGRFEIIANFANRSAAINYGKEVVVKRLPLSIEAILKAYQSAAKSITGRNEAPDQWMAQFYNAWEAARKKRNPAEKRANIVDCYFEMVLQRQPKTFFSAPTKNSFAEYSRAQFAYDLFEIAIRPQRTYQEMVVIAHVAIKSQTDSGVRSMWIVEGRGPHDGRYIGDIVFDKNE
jgi:hypothetical protein